jgi:hypothetical protein
LPLRLPSAALRLLPACPPLALLFCCPSSTYGTLASRLLFSVRRRGRNGRL